MNYENEDLKECSTCGEYKPINQATTNREGFYRRAGTSDGYRHQCKSCYNMQRKYYEKGVKDNFYAEETAGEIGISPDLVPPSQMGTNPIVDHKTCNKCKEYKHISEFHKTKTGRLGRHSTCKLCRIEMKEAKEAAELAESERLNREANAIWECLG